MDVVNVHLRAYIIINLLWHICVNVSIIDRMVSISKYNHSRHAISWPIDQIEQPNRRRRIDRFSNHTCWMVLCLSHILDFSFSSRLHDLHNGLQLERKSRSSSSDVGEKTCHRSIFFYSKFPGFKEHDIYRTPGTVVLDVPEGKYGLTPKTFAALNYSYARYGEEADWFMKADDDVFVIWENLFQFLTRYDATRPHYIVAPSPPSTQFPRGYNSGGAGYLISKPAVSALVETNPKCRRRLYAEDMAFGKWLEQLKVFPTNTLDNSGRQRFHSGNPTTLFPRRPDLYEILLYKFHGNWIRKRRGEFSMTLMRNN